MSSKPVKVILLLAIAASISLVLAATSAFAQNPTPKLPGGAQPNAIAGIVYSQPHNLSGVLLPSSWQEPNGNDADQYVWDNFTLQASTGITITEIHWRGGYQSGSGTVLTFTVAIYPSITGGTQPTTTHYLVQYQPGGNAGETPVGTFGGTAMYDYAFTLPAPFTASAGTPYWVQIEAWQAGVPDWGLAVGSGGNNQHFRRITSGSDIFYQLAPGDAAFTLLGPVPDVPISGLHAENDSPTALGQTTTFTATVSAGSGVSYTWNFGDQTTGSGQVVPHTYPAIGSYTAVVTATNSLGSVAASTPVTITDVPIAGLIAINDSPTFLGNVTSLTATVASGSNIDYQWNFGTGVIGHGKDATYTYATIGFYTAMVTATNSVSVVTATTPITIFGTLPLANAGPDQTVATATQVTLDGSGSFVLPNHRPLTYVWQQLGGTKVMLNSYTISQPTFIAPTAPTILTFTLVVTDAMNLASLPDQVQINVMKHYIYLPLIRR